MLASNTFNHACIHTPLVTERAEEGEKGENLDDMYDLMVR